MNKENPPQPPPAPFSPPPKIKNLKFSSEREGHPKENGLMVMKKTRSDARMNNLFFRGGYFYSPAEILEFSGRVSSQIYHGLIIIRKTKSDARINYLLFGGGFIFIHSPFLFTSRNFRIFSLGFLIIYIAAATYS